MIRQLRAEDIEIFVAHTLRHDRESGTEGELPYGPYLPGVPLDEAAFRAQTLTRWNRPIGEPDWRQHWGMLVDGEIVGSVSLAGDSLASMSHRAHCGLGVERAFRRQGIGRKLMSAAIDWAKNEATLEWIDLGVFVGNDAALALYRSLGFEEVGVIKDMFRVGDWVIDDRKMTLKI